MVTIYFDLWSPRLPKYFCVPNIVERLGTQKMDRAPALPSYRCSLQNFSYNFEDAWFCSDKYNVFEKTSTSITLPVLTVPFFEEKPRFCQLPSTATAKVPFPSFSSTASRTASAHCRVHRFLLLPAVKCGCTLRILWWRGKIHDTAKHPKQTQHLYLCIA
ncbi:hypothetical protein TNCV_4728571 [Trichonephila clavipes]|nr:hypothetical protein TNCV_4728571 [Trichonephila clavipes]